MEFEEGIILYRMRFGLAHQLWEARRFDAQYGRHRNNASADGGLDVLLAEVVRQLRIEDPAERELAREAVEGRRPQW